MIVMILAAGKGERLRPLTESRPKALVEVRGVSLIERHLAALAPASTVVINLGWLGAQIRERIGSGQRYGHTVLFSDEGENILETGGGIVKALPLLGDQPFLVVNADILTDMPLPPADLPDNASAHIVLVPRPSFRSQGDFGLENGRVVNAPAEYTFSGVAIYRPEFFAGRRAERFSVAPMLREAADRGALSGSLYRGGWFDVGTPERLAAANALPE